MKKFTTILLMTLTLSFCLSGCGNSKEIDALKTSIAEKDAIITEKDVEIADLNNQISELNTTITDLQNQIDELTKKIAEQHDYASEIKAREEEAAKQNALHRADPNYVAPPHTELNGYGQEMTVYGSETDPCNKIPENLKPGDGYWIRAFGMVTFVAYGG